MHSKCPTLAVIIVIKAATSTRTIDFLDLPDNFGLISVQLYLIGFGIWLCTLITPNKDLLS